MNIELTKMLKNNNAKVILPGDELPEDYLEIAGAFLADGGDVSIAVPMNISKDDQLLRKLSRQASRCIEQALFGE